MATGSPPSSMFDDPLGTNEDRYFEMRTIAARYNKILDDLLAGKMPAPNAGPGNEVPWGDSRFRQMFYSRLRGLQEGAELWRQARAAVKGLLA